MHAMTRIPPILLLCGVVFVSGCNNEPPPRSVQEFIDNPIMLEAAVVRCSQNRAESRYDAECVNARQAVSIIEAKEERARKDALERQSAAKREALWRTQKAAAEARRRAAEAAERRREAEYLAQFGELPPASNAAPQPGAANAPGAVIPDAPSEERGQVSEQVIFDDLPSREEESAATDGGNAPAIEQQPAADLSDVREELRRRNEDASN